MKKLVPACRSRINRMQAGNNTANASKAMQEVMNHAQVHSGIRISVMPFARKSRVVEMKFSAPNREAMQNRPIEIAHKLAPHSMPGPASLPMALSGVYSVQPAMGGPSGMKNASISTAQAANVVQNDIILNRGNA